MSHLQLQHAALDRFDQLGGGRQSSPASSQTPTLENRDPRANVPRRPID